MHFLLDLLFPVRSLTGGEGEWVTGAELKAFHPRGVSLSEETLRGRGLLYLDRVTGAADYHDSKLLHRAIHLLKYRRIRALAEPLGRIMFDAACSRIDGSEDVLCPIPLHWRRKFWRGFNQSELLAEVLSKETGCEVRHLLRRSRWTGTQVGRKKRERLSSMAEAFAVTGDVPEHVFLVDDICTTGATLEACARVLKEAGVRRVEALVIALD